MTSTTRLQVCGVILVISAAYAVLLAQDTEVASAIASGYVALLLTAIVLVNVWKKP